VHLNLHLTDATQLRAEGYVLDGQLFAEIRWGFKDPTRRLRNPDRQDVVYAAALPAVMPRSWKRVCMPMRRVS
jgi:hypothetical protein